MMNYSITFPGGTVRYMPGGSFAALGSVYDPEHCIIITDNHIAALYSSILKPYKTIIIPPGEDYKNLQTIESLAQQLLQYEIHKKSIIIGVGGGVVTDITGFVASVYMRGISFGFVPTSLLGMVDASIGGKNGVNLGLNKNILGTIQQPKFILFDPGFLKTLPATEWSNGFAEIIKYACLFDVNMFEELSKHTIEHYIQNPISLHSLISKCAEWKNKIVLADEKENNSRKLLNFGHTLGHALENLYHLTHGQAVSLGMIAACTVAENTIKTELSVKQRLLQMVQQYKLPNQYHFDVKKAMGLLKMDKKRNDNSIDYILLEDIGCPVIKSLSFDVIEQILESSDHASHY